MTVNKDYYSYYGHYGFNRDAVVYFNWLVSKFKGVYYESLLWHLFVTPFEPIDENAESSRIVEGAELRDTFVKDVNGNYTCGRMDGVSFLEVLMALAIKVDDRVMYETRYGDRYLDWFWMFIDNMGFSTATDSNWDAEWEMKVDRVTENVMKRRIGEDGTGGMFVVKNRPDNADMRGVDLWRMCMWWLSENIREGIID